MVSLKRTPPTTTSFPPLSRLGSHSLVSYHDFTATLMFPGLAWYSRYSVVSKSCVFTFKLSTCRPSLENVNLPYSNFYLIHGLCSCNAFFKKWNINHFLLLWLLSGTWTLLAKREHAFGITHWGLHVVATPFHWTSVLGDQRIQEWPPPESLECLILGLWWCMNWIQSLWTQDLQGTIPVLTEAQYLEIITDFWPFKVCWKLSCFAENVFHTFRIKRGSSWKEHQKSIHFSLWTSMAGDWKTGLGGISTFKRAGQIRFFIILNVTVCCATSTVALHPSISLSLSLYFLPLILLQVRDNPPPQHAESSMLSLITSYFTYQLNAFILTQVDMVSGDSLGKSSLSDCKAKPKWDTRISEQIYDHLSTTLEGRVHQMTSCCETIQCSLD